MKVITKEEPKWLVLYTKANASKKLAQQLEASGIEAYCPTRTELRQWSDRKKKVEVPVLPSMILVKIKPAERSLVFEFNGAVRFLFWQKAPAEVNEKEIEALRESLEHSSVVKVEIENIQPGQEIDLNELGFKGQKGKVKYVSGNKCWVILEQLGFVVKVTLASNQKVST